MIAKEIDLLRQMDFVRHKTFAYLAAERVCRNFEYFSVTSGFGNIAEIRSAISFLHDTVFDNAPKREMIEKHQDEANNNAPDTENFETIFVSPALDTCVVIFEALCFLKDKDFGHIESISALAFDSVEMYIQELEGLNFVEDKDFQLKVDAHPLMQREVAMQEGIISFLNNSTKLDLHDIQLLIGSQDSTKRSNLEL